MSRHCIVLDLIKLKLSEAVFDGLNTGEVIDLYNKIGDDPGLYQQVLRRSTPEQLKNADIDDLDELAEQVVPIRLDDSSREVRVNPTPRAKADQIQANTIYKKNGFTFAKKSEPKSNRRNKPR